MQELYEDDQFVYIVFDNFQGVDLAQKISHIQQLSEKNVCDIMFKLLLALNHIHQKGIIHRDIKLENIQVLDSKTLEIIICSYGLSENFDLKNFNKNNYKRCGTPGYIAPEIFQSKKYD